MFGLGGISDGELAKLRNACKTRISAYVGCKAANRGAEEPCRNLEVGVLVCLAGKACQEERKAFDRCTNECHEASTAEGRLRLYDEKVSCAQQIEAMRRCLKRKGVWPRLESP